MSTRFAREYDAYSDSAEERKAIALWYAWGQIDAGIGSGKLTLDDGFEFANAQRDKAEDYDREETNHLPSLLSEWQRYLESKQTLIDQG